MVKHKRKTQKGFVAIPVTASISLSTLANNTTLTASLLGTLQEDLYVISAHLTWTIRTLTAGEGPLQVGIAHSDYTVGEVQENIDVTLLGPGKKIEQEQARRLVRRVGMFDGLASEEKLFDGVPIKTTIKWVADDGEDLNVFVSNRSGGAMTTGAIIQCHGTVFGRWLY